MKKEHFSREWMCVGARKYLNVEDFLRLIEFLLKISKLIFKSTCDDHPNNK